MPPQDSYDAIVIGAGPAGSTVATILADAGHSTLLVEREKMPRHHVGESLMPETYWIFERLGLLEKLRQGNCVKKFSVQFVNNKGNASQPFYFHEHDPRDCSQTWQVRRAEFDQMMFENAREKGADCIDSTRVTDILMDRAKIVGIKLQDNDGQAHQISSRVVVDATGQHSLIANRLGLKRVNPDLRKAAIWGHFRGAQRDEGVDEGATVILHTRDKQAWFWYIPLDDNVVSVGCVGDTDYLLKDRGKKEDIFAAEVTNCPEIESRIEDATLDGQLHAVREFSYTTTEHAGDGWVLVGDAYGFVDPIYSSGVYFALKSGEMAADAVVEGFAKDDLSASQLSRWCDEFEGGVRWVRKLVHAFYTNDFSFGRFMKEHPQHRGNLTDLLIGRVFHDSAGEIFKDMDPWLDKLRQDAQPLS
ncbi:MAG: tryptophan 7-halogenase [Pirellulales bacterium]|nr:tryptophan 7-halogenase [Pirellulales bacterium]